MWKDVQFFQWILSKCHLKNCSRGFQSSHKISVFLFSKVISNQDLMDTTTILSKGMYNAENSINNIPYVLWHKNSEHRFLYNCVKFICFMLLYLLHCIKSDWGDIYIYMYI